MEKDAKKLAGLLKVLANQSRLLIFCCLMERPMTVSEIANCVQKITRPALSQHLALLKAHKILDFTKSGQSITYFIADHRVDELINILKKHYCQQQ